MADIFVSYTSSDRDWAFWIGHELEELGHVAHLHDWEISGGENILVWMEARHNDADHILIVISEAYLKAPQGFERIAAQWLTTTSRPNFVLPILIEPCRPPTLLAPLKRCELYGLTEFQARARLADFLKPAMRPSSSVRFPGEKRPELFSHVPVAFPGPQRLGDRFETSESYSTFTEPRMGAPEGTKRTESSEQSRQRRRATPKSRMPSGNQKAELPDEIRNEPAPQESTIPTPAVEQLTTAPFYSDHAAQRDLLNRKAVAETVATMIENVWKEDAKEEKKVEDRDGQHENPDQTFMVHLHGRWGSGKTSILNFLRASLLSQTSTGPDGETVDPSWVVIDYNAWRNQTLGPAWWTLMETVYRDARKQLGGWQTESGQRVILRDRLWRLGSSYARYAFAAGLAIAFLLLLIGVWHDNLFGANKDWFGEGVKLVVSVVGLVAAVFAFGHSYSIGSARTAKSYLELSRDPLSPLVKRYGELVEDIGRPVAVFIDDLDRCNPEFVVELLQTIQTLFRRAKVLYVVAADRDWVCASYQQIYKTFNDSIGEPGKSLGHLFVEKVFQLSVEVPRLSEDERNRYWDELIKSNLASEPKVQQALLDSATREIEGAETESKIIEIVDRYRSDPQVAGIVAAKAFRQMQAAPVEKERQHFLAKYKNLIEPNPRAMKRLLNAYGFRRGFDIQSRQPSDPDALVRWTILENRWPILADYLEGRSSGNDIIKALTQDKAVLEVANGLTWEKLRPVASAPDQPPTPETTPGTAKK